MQESSWEVLRKFNYNDQLELLVLGGGGGGDNSGAGAGRSDAHSTHAELSPSAIRFLKTVFEQFSETHRGVLSAGEQVRPRLCSKKKNTEKKKRVPIQHNTKDVVLFAASLKHKPPPTDCPTD